MKLFPHFFPDILIGLLIVVIFIQYLNIRYQSSHIAILKNNLRILQDNKVSVPPQSSNVQSSINEIEVVDPIEVK